MSSDLRRIAAALERIADALERAVPVEGEPEAADVGAACPHPEDARVDFGLTDGHRDWQCRVCGYRTVEAQ